jgi:DNA polymerase
MTIWCDFETRSECDLLARGAYNYARDPSTRVLCLAWAIDDGEVEIWVPGQEFPKAVADAVVKGDTIRAHNAAFERLIWLYVLGPDHDAPVPKLEQFYCTAAQARANCAPGSLEDVGRFAGASMRKDHRGAALVRKCCCPPFTHTGQDLLDLYEYCRQDVRTMRAISKALRPLSDDELADYHANERINDRGVLIDVDLCRAAQRYAAAESAELQAEVRGLLGDQSLRSVKTREWVLERLPDDQRRLTVTHKDGKNSLDKSVRAALLDLDTLDPDVRVVLQAMDDIWASSTAKFARLESLADEEDHRLRGAFVFAGGAATGRASSYGAQVHNFPRKAAKDAEAVRAAMLAGEAIAPRYGKRVTDVLKTMLRPSMIPAPGHVFIVADWSAIEARVLPWLADSPSGEHRLDVFRRGEDLYIATARQMFNIVDVEPDQRQQAKVAVLACGFQGGVGAFAAMARAYGLTFSETEAKRLVDLWRAANPWAPVMWRRAEDAYLRAMRNPGHEVPAGRVTYLYDRTHLWYALPSGRVLCYPFARFDEDGGVSYAKASWKPKADATEWPRGRLWPGLACENVTQATAHDLLREALRTLEEVVLHIHDEIVLEVPEADAEEARARLVEVMTTAPAWAAGLPLACEAKSMKRYGKG